MRTLEARIPPPVIALGFAVLIWWIARYLPRIEIGPEFKVFMVSALLFIGAFFDLSGLVTFFRARTTVNPISPHKATALVKTGIYKITRNPMYVGLVFFLSAWCIYLESPVALIMVAGFVVYVHVFQILPEERALVRLFGEEYRDYQSRVRRWL